MKESDSPLRLSVSNFISKVSGGSAEGFAEGDSQGAAEGGGASEFIMNV
jgi:hypothetical protein